MRIPVVFVALALAGCANTATPDPEEQLTVSTTPSATAQGGEASPALRGVDPCSLLEDDELSAVFVNLFEPPRGVRTSPGGLTDLCSWQDAAAGVVLRVELDSSGRIPVPPADPSCSDADCPDPGLGLESRADLRNTFRYVVARLDGVTLRVQESGLNLTGAELIGLAAAAAGRVDGT